MISRDAGGAGRLPRIRPELADYDLDSPDCSVPDDGTPWSGGGSIGLDSPLAVNLRRTSSTNARVLTYFRAGLVAPALARGPPPRSAWAVRGRRSA